MSQPPGDGWLPDPTKRHEYRYWDGQRWTEHVSDQGVAAVDALTGDEAPTPMTPSMPVVPSQVRAEEEVLLALRISPEQARDAITNVLEAHGFRLTFADEWTAVAQKGSKGMNVAFGAMAQYFEFGVQIFQDPGGETILRLSRNPVGYWGGLVGRARVAGTFGRIANEVITWLHQQGMLAGIRRAA